jgi:hypothetical protein
MCWDCQGFPKMVIEFVVDVIIGYSFVYVYKFELCHGHFHLCVCARACVFCLLLLF